MRKALVKRGDKIVEVTIDENSYKTGGSNLIKRKDGSYSQRGLWDNIRANKGSGKKPTKQMLEQARKIKNKKQTGGEEMYIPDTGVEQFAPDYSWFEGNPNTAAPGNIVSWPSYPIKVSGATQNQPPIVEDEVPQNMMPQRVAPSRGSVYFNRGQYPGNSMIYLDKPSYQYEEFEPNRNSRLSQWFNNLANNVGDGVENFGDFIGNIEMPKRKRRGFLKKLFRGKGKGLLNCKPGTACARFQEGGEENQFEELLDKIEDALEQDANPQEILDQLVGMGVDQNQAQELIQEAMQDLQEDAKEKEGNEEEEDNGEEKEMGEDDEMYASGGSYRVSKTNERKGKTHKVVGPGGVTKYFGDPKLGEKSKSKYGKKGFYARHKKNLAKNPFFRAYARATWAEGGEPSYMNEPEYKTNSFISKVKEMGQMENDRNLYNDIMEQSQQMLMQMGGSPDNYGYVGNPQLDMYQQAFNEFNSKGNVEGAVFGALNNAGLKLEKGVEMAANVIVPGSGKLVKAGFDAQRPKSMTDSTSQGISGDMLGSMLQGAISDPSQLAGLIVRRGGTLNRFQIAGSVPGYVSPYTTDPFTNQGISTNLTLEEFVKKFEKQNPSYGKQVIPQQPQQYGITNQSLNTPALEPINYFDEQGNYTNFQGPLNQAEQSEITTESTNPVKDPLLKPPVQKNNNISFQNVVSGLPAVASIITSMGNRGKTKKLEAQMSDMTMANNVFTADDTLDRGDFERNTGRRKPNQYIMGSLQGVPALSSAKYGGIQKPGVYMSYPTATPESVVYGKPDKKMSNTLSPVDRDKANLEAEVGETVMTPAGDDGIPKFFKVGGKRHSEGGTPLYLPENSFIFSDTRSMLLGKNMLEEFGIIGKKKKTPAEVAKTLGKGYEKYVKTIQDPNSDSIERKTAEMMIQTQINNLGKLALAQESKKGFPQGIPMISVPYMASIGVNAEQVLPQQEQIPQGMPQGNMIPPEMMQQMPMAKYGLQKYQTGREKQTDILGMDPNAPFPTSSPSAPGERNIAQKILGPLANYFTSNPEEETPIETNVQTVEVISPVKGFKSMEDLDEFITKGDEFGQDFNALYNDYSQTIKTIDELRTGLIEGWIPLDVYEQYKEGIDSRIGEIKTEIDESQKRIPWYKSWTGNPGSTADKLQDIAGILDEEKEKLKFRASDLRKFKDFQNNVSFLETEKQNIIQLLNSDIDNLEKVRLKRRLTDLNDALNYETDRTNQFGNRAFNRSKPMENVGYTNEGPIYRGLKEANRSKYKRYYEPDVYRQYGDIGIRKFTYDDYLKQYESKPIGTTVKPAYESQQGSLNGNLSDDILSTAPEQQDTVPVETAPVSTPSKQTKSDTPKSKTNQSVPSKFKKIEGDDLNLF